MSGRRLTPGVHFSATPEAQRIRWEWIVAELRNARNGAGGEYATAIGMIAGTKYMLVGPAERLRYIERILDALTEVTGEES